ncbi:MAG: hypothetical protein GY822_13045 [Deltaproteobacteria bacterium]|nr:hypothetical protein [Deltaproteobacteria bacterium]
MPLYGPITTLFGVGLEVYFQRKEVQGTLPGGPLLVVANHPNGIMDPALLGHIFRRRLRFLGKEPLFRMPVISLLVKGTGTLPVYRTKDGADTSANEEMFRAVYQSLDEGEAICLFPEGISHNEPNLQPLKTGAARMAFGAEHDVRSKSGRELQLKIVPVGIVYQDKRRFRSSVSISVGEPISLDNYKDLYDDNEREAVQKLTQDIDVAIREQTLNLDAWSDMPLLHLAERIWDEGLDPKGHDEDIRLRQLSMAFYELQQHQPERARGIQNKVASFYERMQKLGLNAADLDTEPKISKVLRFSAYNLIALVLGTPIALLGTLFFALPYGAIRLIAGRRKERDLVATVALFAGALIFPTWTFLMAAAASFYLPLAWVLPMLFWMPLCGLYANRFFRRRRESLREIQLFFTFSLSKRLRKHIAEERAELATDMNELEVLVRQQRGEFY